MFASVRQSPSQGTFERQPPYLPGVRCLARMILVRGVFKSGTSAPVAHARLSRQEAKILRAEQIFHAAPHLGMVGDAERVAMAGNLPPVGQTEQKLELALAGIAAENFVEHLSLLHPVVPSNHAKRNTA